MNVDPTLLTKPITLSTNNFPIMVDARPNSKTLTWPAEPFSADHFDLNTTAYFNSELVSNDPLTYKFYTPAFEQYASPKNQKYVLAVVEPVPGSYVVKFVNEATVIGATSTYTNIILEGLTRREKIFASMHVIDKNRNKVYLSPGPRGILIASTIPPNPAFFMIKFHVLKL